MRFAYADPPYPGMAHLYKDHPDYAGEVDHKALIERLVSEFPDGWALSTYPQHLRDLLPMCPADVRPLAWCQPNCDLRPSLLLQYRWEVVILSGGRNIVGEYVSDWIITAKSVALRHQSFIGQKPEQFCFWLFRCLGALPGDELVDLFPGSGAVSRAWDKYQRQTTLPLTDEREKQTRLMEVARAR